MSSPLAGRTALVTGAGSGIGAAIAEALGRAGARLVVLGRRPEPLGEVVDRIVAASGSAVAMVGDVRDYGAMARGVQAAIARFGALDILVANAAVADVGPIDEADPDLYRDVIETNVIGVLNSIRAALPHMLGRAMGHVVVLASVSGRITYVGEPAYVASKHASIAFADCLRQEVAERGIRVTTIEPGLVETPLIHVHPAALDMVPGVVPLDPDDIARAVIFALEQPARVNVAEIVLRPTMQIL
jgi:NADP-dependent 3-hydroxy acid dehydrogenase YdfG